MEIKDKPDLQCDEVGVEVTIATDRNYQEALNNWIKANYCEDDVKKQKYIERMQQLKVEYKGGTQYWSVYSPSFKMIRDVVNHKIKKLETGKYRKYDNYELFVFSDMWMYESKIEEGKEFFDNNNVYASFRRVYILEIGYILNIFEEGDYRRIEINETEQADRNIRAREMVELAEEQ